MKTHVTFRVTDEQSSGNAVVSSPVLARIMDLLVAGLLDHSEIRAKKVWIDCLIDNPALAEVVKLVRSEGGVFLLDGHFVNDSRQGIETIYNRTYSPAELDCFGFFSVGLWGQAIYEGIERDGARWLADSVDPYSDSPARPLTFDLNGRMGFPVGLNYFVQDEVRNKMIASGFLSDFFELKGVHGETLSIPFHEIVPRIRTPACLLPVTSPV